jgi:hypothetical protein
VRPQSRSLFEPAPSSDCELGAWAESQLPGPPLGAPIAVESREEVMSHEPSGEFPIILPPKIPPGRREGAPQAADAAVSISLPIHREPAFVEERQHDNLTVDHSSEAPRPPGRKSPIISTVMPPPDDGVNSPVERNQTRPALSSILRPSPAMAGTQDHVERAPRQKEPVRTGAKRQPTPSIQPLFESSRLQPKQSGAVPATANPFLSSAPDTRPAMPKPTVEVLETVEPESSRGELAPLAPVARVRPVVPVRTRLSSSLPEAAAAMPSTVHVTIGRVEVRATLPAPTGARVRPAAPPVMSLEDYLGRRAAGGQR